MFGLDSAYIHPHPKEAIMSNQVQVTIDRDVYDRLMLLEIPPIDDINGAIKSLLEYEGHPSPAVMAAGIAGHHFSMSEEMERTKAGVYDCGGAT